MGRSWALSGLSSSLHGPPAFQSGYSWATCMFEGATMMGSRPTESPKGFLKSQPGSLPPRPWPLPDESPIPDPARALPRAPAVTGPCQSHARSPSRALPLSAGPSLQGRLPGIPPGASAWSSSQGLLQDAFRTCSSGPPPSPPRSLSIFSALPQELPGLPLDLHLPGHFVLGLRARDPGAREARRSFHPGSVFDGPGARKRSPGPENDPSAMLCFAPHLRLHMISYAL